MAGLLSFVTSGYPRPSAIYMLKVKTRDHSEYPLHYIRSPPTLGHWGDSKGLLGVRILCDQTIHSDRGTHPFRDRLVLRDKETTYRQLLVELVGLAGRPQNTLRA